MLPSDDFRDVLRAVEEALRPLAEMFRAALNSEAWRAFTELSKKKKAKREHYVRMMKKRARGRP